LVGAVFASQSGAHAAGAPAFSLVNVGAYGGEPSLVSDANGVLYDSTPSGLPSSAGALAGQPPVYRSTDKGATWTMLQPADTNSGDTCLATDQSNALYWCNLGSMTSGSLPLQADVWKTTVPSTCTASCAWVHGDGAAPGSCSTSCNPFGVDRQWTAASIIPPATDTSKAEVVLMYHDFYGPSQIWVNISQDGGKTFGAPVEVLASPAVTPGGITGSLTAEGYTFCNTVPAGVNIVKQGLPHAGRIYVAWIAADIPSNATGCNITMTQSFHTVWISSSDDNGATWTAQQAFDAGIGHDASTPFVAFTLDDQGNPYIGFTAPGPSDNPAVCAADSTAGTVQTDNSCDYTMQVVWSHDGGVTWDGGGGLIPGSAATAYQVSPATETGTDVFPTIAAAGPGQVDVGYLHTPTVVPTDPLGKFDPGGCAGNAAPAPPTFPPTCNWNLYQGQSSNLLAAPGTATFTTSALSATPMHTGDICNLGIACIPTVSNRNLLDFNQETIDPTTGCAHIAYADDNTVNKLRAANQTTGCFAVASVNVAEAPWIALLIPAGAVAALLGGTVRRRRLRLRSR
jgi:hypothetical protein